MATDLEYLQAQKTRILAALSSLSLSHDYSIDGQSEQIASGRKALLDELVAINALIAAEDPFEIIVQAYP